MWSLSQEGNREALVTCGRLERSDRILSSGYQRLGATVLVHHGEEGPPAITPMIHAVDCRDIALGRTPGR